MLRRLLIVTAVPAERDAVLAGMGDTRTLSDPAAGIDGATVLPDPLAPDAAEVDVVAAGVGTAAAAAATARRIALAAAEDAPYHAVVSAGIAGGFAGRVEIGDVVLATAAVAADLGAELPDGFLPLDDLNMGASATLRTAPDLLSVPAAHAGTVLTVNTVTGSADTARELADRHPEALAEAMEGYGVGIAAARVGLPFTEVRAISNIIGPRDLGAWRLADALAALTDVFTAHRPG